MRPDFFLQRFETYCVRKRPTVSEYFTYIG